MNADIKYEELNTDIRAEALASYFMEDGMDVDNVIIEPVGNFQRPYRKDILSIGRKPEKPELPDSVFIEISRNGLYDLLPEGLFHQPPSGKSRTTVPEIIDEIRKTRKEEESAREFFLAIEKEIYRARILLETEERKSILSSSRYFKKKLYFSLWENLRDVSEEYLAVLFQLLPISHKVSGNIELTKICMESILGESVEIKTSQAEHFVLNKSASNRLGYSCLGTDFIIGNRIKDYNSYVDINISLRQKNNLTDYIEGGKASKVLKIMEEYFFPSDVTVIVNVLLNKTEDSMVLSDDSADARLGYTSKI